MENQVNQVLLGRLDRKGKLDRGGLLAMWVSEVHKVNRALKVHRGCKDHLVQRVPQGPVVNKDLKARWGQLAHKALQECRALRVLSDLGECLDREESVGLMDSRAIQARPASVVREESREKLEIRVIEVQTVHAAQRDPEEKLELKAQLDSKAPLGRKEIKASEGWMVQWVSEDRKASKVQLEQLVLKVFKASMGHQVNGALWVQLVLEAMKAPTALRDR